MRKTHVVGLLLWRGGLLLAAGAALFQVCRLLLRFFSLPLVLEVGLGLVGTGLLLLLASVVLERVRDAREEREWAP